MHGTALSSTHVERVVDLISDVVRRVHRRIYETTRGLIGHRILLVPTLLLTTVDRRTHKASRTALVYGREGQEYVVVASAGGADDSPGWFYRLEARPDVEVRVGLKSFPAKARIVDKQDPSYARLLRMMNDINRQRYRAYQAKTDRQIPVVLLTPSG